MDRDADANGAGKMRADAGRAYGANHVADLNLL